MSEEPKPIVVDEGEVGQGHGYRAKSDLAIKELALHVVEGRIFGTWDIPAHEIHAVSMVFMPLAFMDELTVKQMEADNIVHYYSYMDKALPRSINGMPIFHSMQLLSRDDATRLQAQIERLQEYRKQFMESSD